MHTILRTQNRILNTVRSWCTKVYEICMQNMCFIGNWIQIKVLKPVIFITLFPKYFLSETEAESRLSAVAEAPGYISVAWEPPTVALPERENYSLNGHYFLLNLTHTEDGGDGGATSSLVVETHNTSDTSLVLPSPLWGSQYR